MQKLLKTIIEEYTYNTREERDSHVVTMEKSGWECTGQVRKDMNGSLDNPNYVWYGQFYKYER